VGAVLTQNTSWKNVTLAIANLKAAGALDLGALHQMEQDALAGIIRPSGYYNVKAKRLKNLVGYIVSGYNGNLERFFDQPATHLRRELLSVNGIGNETADSILLYAAQKPIFVVDAYTRRVLGRHGIVPLESDYDSIQEFFHQHLPKDTSLFNDYHAQLVAVGHNHCKKRPICKDCPLSTVFSGHMG
jgi:endonuclease III related protein